MSVYETLQLHASTSEHLHDLRGSSSGSSVVKTHRAPHVMIVDDDPVFCVLLRSWLIAEGYAVSVQPDGESCLRALETESPEAICLDLNLPGLSGTDTLERIVAERPHLPVVMLTAESGVERAVEAIKAGAVDYLTKPPVRSVLLRTLHDAIRQGRTMTRLARLKDGEGEGEGGSVGILGESEAMKSLFRQLDRVAQTDVTVLILGESGTGKELVARAVHELSRRRRAPLHTINCATIPESLQESALFGHERGAFTGATSAHAGLFERANGGTVFLDEAGELSLSAQAKLLRVVQEGTFQRVGGERQLQSDFRLIAATNRDLLEEVRAGRFREDLYFRLAVFELEVPPLRERGDDVVLLAGEFARVQGERLIGRPVSLSPDAVAMIERYSWPGNVRELENAVQRAVVASTGGTLTRYDFPSRIRRAVSGASAAPVSSPGPVDPSGVTQSPVASGTAAYTPPPPSPREAPEGETLEQRERAAIAEMLRITDGNIAEASRRLGIGRSTLYRKMDRYGLR